MLKLKYFIIGIILIVYTLNVCGEVYILEENNKINTLDDQYIITERIISDILFDNNNFYFASRNNVYIVNKTSKVITSKTKIDNISKLTQDENYLYASSKNILYKIYKTNGSFALKQILANNILDIFTGYWYCYNCTITYINNSYYNYTNITGNGTGNFTNYFDEIFVNKISLNKTSYQQINLNESIVLNKTDFTIYSPSYLSKLNIRNNNFSLLYYDSSHGNFTNMDIFTKDENVFIVHTGNVTEETHYNQYGSLFQWLINYNEAVLINTEGITLHNKVILDELKGSNKYLKVNNSGEIYAVTPIINVTANYTNHAKLVGTVYTNSYDFPIYLNIRVGCYSTVGNTECNVNLLNNNHIINQHYLSPMGVNQYYIHSFVNIIPAGTNYSLVNNGSSQLLLYTWNENNVTVQ